MIDLLPLWFGYRDIFKFSTTGVFPVQFCE